MNEIRSPGPFDTTLPITLSLLLLLFLYSLSSLIHIIPKEHSSSPVLRERWYEIIKVPFEDLALLNLWRYLQKQNNN